VGGEELAAKVGFAGAPLDERGDGWADGGGEGLDLGGLAGGDFGDWGIGDWGLEIGK
jgi:hypothetical protein